MATTEIHAEPGTPFIDMRREFDAPVELLYRAYTEPELLKQWLGPRGYEMEVVQWEPRDGGVWRYLHRAPDGQQYGFRGVFHGEQSPAGMLQTFEFEGAPGHVSLEALHFERHDGRTVVVTHSVYQSVADRDAMIASGMETGVVQGFERLDELLATLGAAVA